MKRNQDNDSYLNLSLSPPSNNPPSNPPRRTSLSPPPSKQPRVGRKEAKNKKIDAPFSWATEYRATVHPINYLLENGIHTIEGDVQCKKCDKVETLKYNLQEKFQEVGMYIMKEQDQWHNRAPKAWTDPKFPTCKICGEEDSCKPVMSEKKKSINWLFLLLGQLLGHCTLEQLKYFCKHAKLHRTGAKNRLVYLTYFALCKQLDPNGPF